MKRRFELFLVGGAAAACVGSCIWFGFLEGVSRRSVRHDPALVGGDRPMNVTESPSDFAGTDAQPVWDAPAGQRQSRQWVYDLFTPPEIFYDAASNAFSVTPALTALSIDGRRGSTAVTSVLDITLLEVKRPLFPLQLMGFVRADGGHFGLFENTTTGEVFVGRAGHRDAGLRLVIEAVEIGPKPVLIADSMSTLQLRATARLRDEATNEIITLTSSERCYAGKAGAVVAIGGPDGMRREIGEGDIVELGELVYEVSAVRLMPPGVELRRRSSDGGPEERRTLALIERAAVERAVPTS